MLSTRPCFDARVPLILASVLFSFANAALNPCREFSIAIPVKECMSVFTPPPLPIFATGPSVLSTGDCVRELREEEQEVGMGRLILLEVPQTEDKSPVDPDGSPLKEQVSENVQGCKSGVKFRGMA